MNNTEVVLAKKYATAFLNIYGDKISLDDYHAIKNAAEYCKRNYRFFFLLNTPTIPLTTKRTTLVKLFSELQISNALQPLVELILKHQRLFLLPTIFKQITIIYENRKKIVPFAFISSHILDRKQLETLSTFLAKKINRTIMYNQIQNKKLIAGVRMQSTVFLWEYSIAKQLNALRNIIR